MKKISIVILSIFYLLSISGCVAVLVGAGVAGGIAISEDTVKLERDTSFRRAWAVSTNTVKSMGSITLQDKTAGKIEAIVRDTKIHLNVLPVTPKTVRIEVKARKNFLPNINLATEIINTINSRL